VLYIEGKGKEVILEDINITGGTRGDKDKHGAGLNIKGTTASKNPGEGVIVTFKGSGKITRNGDSEVNRYGSGIINRGAGVYVDYFATFILDGGTISENWQGGADSGEGGGGGIYAGERDSGGRGGTVILKSGFIRNNYTYNDGGGVSMNGSKSALDM
jgi:hypothetical protein